MKPRTKPAADLSPAVIAIVLSGWGAKPPDEKVSPRDGVFALAGGWHFADANADDLFEIWEQREAGVVRVWHRHRAFLEATAQRWGVKPRFRLGGRQVFYGEWCSVPFPERGHDHDDDDDTA